MNNEERITEARQESIRQMIEEIDSLRNVISQQDAQIELLQSELQDAERDFEIAENELEQGNVERDDALEASGELELALDALTDALTAQINRIHTLHLDTDKTVVEVLQEILDGQA